LKVLENKNFCRQIFGSLLANLRAAGDIGAATPTYQSLSFEDRGKKGDGWERVCWRCRVRRVRLAIDGDNGQPDPFTLKNGEILLPIKSPLSLLYQM